MSTSRRVITKLSLKGLAVLSVLITVLILSAVLTGCSSTPKSTPSPAPATTTAPSATATPTSTSTSTSSSTKTPNSTPSVAGDQYSIAVFSGDNQVAALKLDDLLKLPQVSVTADGKAENGPTLLSALAAAGIKDFSTITAYGYSKGRVATAELTLNKSQINDQVVLDISNQGTAKLAGPDIPGNSWIIDVNKLVAK